MLVRTDADHQRGSGHFLRCLALAQMWNECGGRSLFAVATDIGSLAHRLRAEQIPLHRIATEPGSRDDCQMTAKLARQLGAVWIIVDGYHFDDRFQRQLLASGPRLLVIDDDGNARHYVADLLLNQNHHADAALYAGSATGELLLGPQYVLLRREFRRRLANPPAAPASPASSANVRSFLDQTGDGCEHRILVTLGGSDPENVTLRVAEALGRCRLRRRKVHIVVGSNNPHYESLRSLLVDDRRFQLHADVADMSSLMDRAEVAVSAAGSTVWELACRGVPSVLLVLADNQVSVARAAARQGIGVNLGWHHQVAAGHLADVVERLCRSPDERQAMGRRGQRLIDGQGASRVVRAMKGIAA